MPTLVSTATDLPTRQGAQKATQFLKTLANEQRLALLCLLANKRQHVSDLVEKTGFSQSAVSQHLQRFRAENLVEVTRVGKNSYYQLIAGQAVTDIIQVLHQHFCQTLDN